MHWTKVWMIVSLCSAGLVAALVVHAMGTAPTPASPMLGHRGARRRDALRRHAGFRLIEPIVRILGGWLSPVLPARARQSIDERLVQADDYLGWSAGEHAAASLLCALLFAGVGATCVVLGEWPRVLLIPATAFGAVMPHLQIEGVIARRVKDVQRGLPAAIDLASMCMHAGLDFPGSLRLIVRESPPDDALCHELARVLQQLDFGHTREQALLELRRRVPAPAVRDFVNAVVQSEQKGHSLSGVLHTQAGVLRAQRSVAAEEAAARAGVMMMLPLMLLLSCILVLLFGALMIDAMKAGF